MRRCLEGGRVLKGVTSPPPVPPPLATQVLSGPEVERSLVGQLSQSPFVCHLRTMVLVASISPCLMRFVPSLVCLNLTPQLTVDGCARW